MQNLKKTCKRIIKFINQLVIEVWGVLTNLIQRQTKNVNDISRLLLYCSSGK